MQRASQAAIVVLNIVSLSVVKCGCKMPFRTFSRMPFQTKVAHLHCCYTLDKCQHITQIHKHTDSRCSRLIPSGEPHILNNVFYVYICC